MPIDDQYAKIHKEELKYIESVYLDYTALKDLRAKDLEKIDLLGRVISDKDKLIALKEEDINYLKEQIEDIMPSWWNRFSYGFIAGVLVSLITLLTLRGG